MNSGDSAPRAAGRWPLILWVRKIHLYLGVLFAPAVLFFASTGMVQVLSLHQSSPGYNAPILLQRLGALHKDQVFGARTGPRPLGRPSPAPPAARRAPTAGRPPLRRRRNRRRGSARSVGY